MKEKIDDLSDMFREFVFDKSNWDEKSKGDFSIGRAFYKKENSGEGSHDASGVSFASKREPILTLFKQIRENEAKKVMEMVNRLLKKCIYASQELLVK